MGYIPKNINSFNGYHDDQIEMFYSLKQYEEHECLKEYKIRVGNNIEKYFYELGFDFSTAKNPKNAKATKKKEIMLVVENGLPMTDKGVIKRSPTYDAFSMWCQKKIAEALLNQYKKMNENIKRGKEIQIVSEVKTIERNVDYKVQYEKTLKEMKRYKKMYDKERNINKVVNSDEEDEEVRIEKEVKNVVNDIVKKVESENKLRQVPKPIPRQAPKVEEPKKEFHELSWKEMKVVLREMNISEDELDDIVDNNDEIESRKKCATKWFNKKTNKITTFNEEEHQGLINRMNNAKKLLIKKEFQDRHMNMFLGSVYQYYVENDDSDEVVKYVYNYFTELLKHSPSQEITDTFMDRYKKRLATFH
jgi:hypothetical protein